MKTVVRFVAISAFLAATSTAHAAPIPWVAGNGHYYDAIAAPNGISWTDAKAAAEAMTYLGGNGHLATLTSVEENAFVSTTFNPSFYILGGSQGAATTFSDNWSWVTGETWSFTSWNFPPEPNDGNDGVENGSENYLHFWFGGPNWNDYTGVASPTVPGYIVEFEAAQNGTTVPEPSSMLLLGTGLIGVARRWYGKKA